MTILRPLIAVVLCYLIAQIGLMLIVAGHYHLYGIGG